MSKTILATTTHAAYALQFHTPIWVYIKHFAIKVFPRPGTPESNNPLGIVTPNLKYLSGFFNKEIDEFVPVGVDFAVHITGDNMMPMY